MFSLFRVKNLLSNHDSREIISGSFTIITIKIVMSIVALIASIIITRYLDSKEAGYYFFMISMLSLLSTVGRIGLDHVVTRLTAIANSNGDSAKIRQITSISCIWSLKVSVIISFVLFVFCKTSYSLLFNDNGYLMPLYVVCLLIPLTSLLTLLTQSFQGMKKVIRYSILSGLTRIFNLVGLLLMILVAGTITIEQLLLIFLMATVLASLAGYWSWKNLNLSHTKPSEVDFNALKGDMLKSSLSLWSVACLSIVIGQGAQILIGIMSDPEQVAYFAVANRVATFIAFLLLAVNGILSPKFAEIHAKNDNHRLQEAYRSSTRIMLLLTLPLFIIIFTFSKEILLLFGSGYEYAVTVLRLLIFAQFVKVAVGSVGYLLIMTGHEKKQRTNLILAASILVIGSVLLIPLYGAVGAAVAVFFAITTNNLLGFREVYKNLKISLF